MSEKLENNAVTDVQAMQTVTTGVSNVYALDMTKLTKSEDLVALIHIADSAGERFSFYRCVALDKLRTMYADEKLRVSTKNKLRAKGEKKYVVSIYGYEKFVDLCEGELGMSRSLANAVANVAKFVTPDGRSSIFKAYFENGDLTFTVLSVLSPLSVDDITLACKEGAITPSMTVQAARDYVKAHTVPKKGVKDVVNNPVENALNAEKHPDATREKQPDATREKQSDATREKQSDDKYYVPSKITITMSRDEWEVITDVMYRIVHGSFIDVTEGEAAILESILSTTVTMQ